MFICMFYIMQRCNVAIGTLKNFFTKKTSQKNVSTTSDTNGADFNVDLSKSFISSPTNFSKKTDTGSIIDTTRNFTIEDEYDEKYNESESTINIDNNEYDSASENDSEKSSASTSTSISARRKRKSTEKKRFSKRKEPISNESTPSVANIVEDEEEFQYEQAETVVVENAEFDDDHASEQSLSTSSRRRKHRKHRSSSKLSTDKSITEEEKKEEKMPENRKSLTFPPPPLPSPPVQPPTDEERKRSISVPSISSIGKVETPDTQERPITPRTPRTPRKSSQNTGEEMNKSSDKIDYFGAVESALERSRSGNDLLRRSSSRRSSLALSISVPVGSDTSTTAVVTTNNTTISEEKDNVNIVNGTKILPKLELKNVEQVSSVILLHHSSIFPLH
jgi:hypothetical protein